MIDSIINKLKEFNINNIVSIDNDWRKKVSNFNFNSNLEEFLKKNRISINDNEKRLIRNNMIELVDDLMKVEDNELERIKTRIKEISNKGEVLDATLASLNEVFNKIKERDSNIKIYTENSLDIDLLKYEGNTLYILDRNMGEGYEDVIVDKILEIKQDANNLGSLILIYSSECGNDYDTHESKLRYLTEKKEMYLTDENKLAIIYQLWAIKKVGNYDKLIEDINEMLSKSMYGTSLTNIVNHKKNAESNAYKDLILIDIEDLQGTFIDSFIEGDNIIASFNRIMGALINKNYNLNEEWSEKIVNSYQYLIEYEKSKIDQIKNFIVGTGNSDEGYKSFKKEHIKKKLSSCTVNASEYGVADYSINKLYRDVGTGDLFRYKKSNTSNWQYCMVLSQECNNVIRMPIDKIADNPNRNNKDIKLLIFNIEEIPSGEMISNSKLSKLNNSIATRVWPIKIDEKYYSLSPTEKVIFIDSHILDVCTLNEDGKAIRKTDISKALKLKGYQSSIYFQDFYHKDFWVEFSNKGKLMSMKYKLFMEEYLQECSVTVECNTQCIVNEEEYNFVKSMEEKLFDDVISMTYGIEYCNEEFMLERICRIESKRALLAIQDYVYKLSRAGTDPVIAFSS